MLPGFMMRPRRVLMTVDAVGGVGRYAIDLARGMNLQGIGCLLAGAGPRSDGLAREAASLPDTRLVWTDEILDWMATDERQLDSVPVALEALARVHGCDLLHLNLPSQAVGIAPDFPIVVASHSCVPTWWAAMRGTPLPMEWSWQKQRNRRGLDRADGALVPSASHGAALVEVYGPVDHLDVVYNTTRPGTGEHRKEPFVLAAGRWWDEAKNAATLDRAAAVLSWPLVMAGPVGGPNGETFSMLHARPAGEIQSCDLMKLMGHAAIFVAASRYEPFGLAVLEAAMRGAALVLADIPTFRELWPDAALFVQPMDAPAFAAAITRLAEDQPLRASLAARAAGIAGDFTASRQADGVIASYGRAMARHGQFLPGAG